MKKIIFTLLLCLFATNVFCSDNDGRWWNGLSEIAKTYYIIGFSNAYTEMLGAMQIAFEDFFTEFATNVSEEKIDKNAIQETSLTITKSYNQYPYGYNYGEIAEFTDKFFSNPQYKVLNLNAVLILIIFPALKDSLNQEEIDKRALSLLKATKTDREQK